MFNVMQLCLQDSEIAVGTDTNDVKTYSLPQVGYCNILFLIKVSSKKCQKSKIVHFASLLAYASVAISRFT